MLRRCGIDLNWNTDVNDDLPWGLCDRMDGRLWEEFRYGERYSSGNVACLKLVPEVEIPLDEFKPLLLVLLWQTK